MRNLASSPASATRGKSVPWQLGLAALCLALLPACAGAQEPKPVPLPAQPATQERAAVSLREQAYGAENRDDFAVAAEAFLQLVAKEPHNAEWVVSAGRCLGRSGRFSDAIDLLDGGRAKFPGAIEVPAMLARTYLLKGERDRGALNPEMMYAEAATLAEGVLELEPNHEDSRLVLAQARYMLGDWDQAVAQAEEAVKRHPARPGAHILLGRIATDRMRDLLATHAKADLKDQALADLVGMIDRERQTAKKAFRQAAALDPTRAHPHVMLARIALFDHKDAEVRAHLLDALAIDPDARVDHAEISKDLDWNGRREAYASALDRYVARPDVDAKKAATLRWFVGKAFFDGRQWAPAREAFEAVIAANPAAINSYYYAALAAYELGDHDAAEAHAGAYAAISALGFADVVRNLGGEARGQVAAIIKFLGDRAYQRGNKARSRDLNHVIALLYDTADAWNNRAFLCRETGEFDDALSAYRRALEKEPTSPQLHNDTGVILQYHLPNATNLAEAKSLYARAIELADKVLADGTASTDQKARAAQAKADAAANLSALK